MLLECLLDCCLCEYSCTRERCWGVLRHRPRSVVSEFGDTAHWARLAPRRPRRPRLPLVRRYSSDSCTTQNLTALSSRADAIECHRKQSDRPGSPSYSRRTQSVGRIAGNLQVNKTREFCHFFLFSRAIAHGFWLRGRFQRPLTPCTR